ncbi:hypothetical protein ACFWP7_30090 [Streptomyces sp. NPDC058470]|uniref:hypothetical protein n=1 Tax=Streptomyces sp. NPDC058470 TaxID=3346515 RepID=UPI0036649648
MRRARTAAASAVVALALAGGGWTGGQNVNRATGPTGSVGTGSAGPAGSAESLTRYDPADPRQVAATADDVFIADVLDTAGRRTIDEIDWDLYRVRVGERRKGDRTGTVQVAVEHGGPPLKAGATYLFATNRFPHPADGNGQVAETTPRAAPP